MYPQQKNLLIARINSGILRCKVDNTVYVVKAPSAIIRYEAEELYHETLYKESFNESWFTKNEVRARFLEPNIDSNQEALSKRQDDLLVEIYENFDYDDLKAKLKKQLSMVRQKINENLQKLHYYDFITSEGLADIVKTQYLLAYSTFYLDDTPVWTCEFSNIDYVLLDKIMNEVNKNFVDFTTLRYLARTEPWRGYWSIQKDNIFGVSVLDMTEEQRALITFSRMYDNISSHSDAPAEKIINDDDALDGWMILKRREQEKNQTEKELTKVVGKHHENAKDVFIMTSNIDKHGQQFNIDRNKIDSMNTREAQMVKAQREKTIEQKGTVMEHQLPDVQLDIINQRAQLQNPAMRK